MSDYVEPKWEWDAEARAGYIDLNPEYEGPREGSLVIDKGGVTVVVDRIPGAETIVGIEVLV